MTREWLITARLREDSPKSIRPRDREDIEEIMGSCCDFITEHFLNLELTYRILGVQADAPEKIKKEMKNKMNDKAVTWTAADEEEHYKEQKAYRKKHKIPMER